MAVGAAQQYLSDLAQSLGLDPENPEHLAKAMVRSKQLRAQVARHDPNAFCRYVLRDERTNKPVKQAPLHREWQELLKNDRVLLWSHIEAGKTNQIAIGRVLYELGHDPSLRVAVVSNTNELAKKMTRQLGQYIEKSAALHDVFPNLRPTDDPGLPWRAQALTVRRPGMGAKDASVQACGVHGNIIGSRIDLFVFDDILDFENTNTPAPRDDVYNWVKNIMGRLTANGRVWFVGNAWHPNDVMHRLEKEQHFTARRYPVINEKGELTWPERWSHERIAVAKRDFTPLEYARQLLCQARDDTSARFKAELIEKAKELGRDVAYCESLQDLWHEQGLTEDEMQAQVEAREAIWRLGGAQVGIGGMCITGVDLAVQRHDAADLTSMVTIYVDPLNKTRRVLNIESGRWTGPEIIDKIKDLHRRFGSYFVVENNAAQHYIVQMVNSQTAIPVWPFTTGRNKAHPEFGVEGLAGEFAGGKWIIPNKGGIMHPEINEWVRELLFYDPREHTGDRVMASWFAREGARMFVDNSAAADGSGGVSVRVF